MKLQTSGVLGTSYAIAKLAPKRSYHQLAEIAQEWQAKRDILYANNLRFGTTAHVLTAHSTNLDTELRFYQNSLNKLNAEYRIKIAQKVEELAKTDNHLEPYTPPEEYLYIFKEEYIDKKYSTNEEDNATHYINNKAFVPLQKELKYPYVDKIITSTTFTHNRSYFTDHVDKYVYPTIDAVSVLFSIFAPSLDAIPDGIGLFYSTLRGNTGNISNYTIALTIPAASALSVTAVKLTVAKQQGKNVYRIVNNTVEATANATDEAARELLTKYLAQGDISQEAYNQLINKQGKELSDGLIKALDDESDRLYKALTDNAGAGDVFKNIDLATFKKTFRATEEQYAKAYKLWGEEKWDELYQYFKANDLNNWNGINWPPFNGAKSILKTEKGSQLAGKVFDRFQTGYNADKLGGGFASPVLNSNEGVADLVFTYDSRALADRIQEGTYYYKFKIKDNVPDNLEFEYGEAIPWFNLHGNADQIKSSMKFGDLKDNIEIIEVLKFERGSWKKIQ